MSSFCEIYHLTDIIKQSTCFKNPSNPSGIHIEFFKNIFLKVLNKHAPIKTKYLRANHSPFVTRELSKTVMLKSKLQNQYLKCKSEEGRVRYKIHRNLCVTLLRTQSQKITQSGNLSVAIVYVIARLFRECQTPQTAQNVFYQNVQYIICTT